MSSKAAKRALALSVDELKKIDEMIDDARKGKTLITSDGKLPHGSDDQQNCIKELEMIRETIMANAGLLPKEA